MAVNWPLYETLLCNGATTTRRDVTVSEAVNSLASGIVDDPAYQENAKIDGEISPIVASRKSTAACLIKAIPPTDIHIGDMVECFNEHWIVVELYVDKVGIINGEMWLCNSILRFQNRSVSVISRHCVIDDGTYSKKSSDPDAFVMTNTYKIYITIDDETKKMFVDKRLALGQVYSASGEKILEVYKIIGIDVKSKNFGAGSHLMVLTVQRDVYDESVDSLSENICDIFVGNGDIAEPKVAGSCVLAGRDTIRLGTSRKYTVTFTNTNGSVEPNVVPLWTVRSPGGVTYTTSGTECTVNVPLNEKYVGETITITVSDNENIFGSYEKKVQVVTVG